MVVSNNPIRHPTRNDPNRIQKHKYFHAYQAALKKLDPMTQQWAAAHLKKYGEYPDAVDILKHHDYYTNIRRQAAAQAIAQKQRSQRARTIQSSSSNLLNIVSGMHGRARGR